MAEEGEECDLCRVNVMGEIIAIENFNCENM